MQERTEYDVRIAAVNMIPTRSAMNSSQRMRLAHFSFMFLLRPIFEF